MSETDGDLPDLEGPGTDLALDVVDAEPVDDDEAPAWGTPDEIVDAEITGDTGAELDLRGTHVYAGWGQPDHAPTGPTGKHVDRDFIPEHGISGGGAGTGRRKPTRKERKQAAKGGGTGGTEINIVRFGGGNRRTVNTSLIDNRGAAGIKTAPVNSGNTAGWHVAGGPKKRGGGATRIAAKAKRRKW